LIDTIDLEQLAGRFSDRIMTKMIIPKIGKMLRVKPALNYLEIHIVDHCNLNCKGCTHFSPIADEYYANPDEFARDMQQVKRLFSTIRYIRLMGGEPLLHPQIELFLFHARDCFPKADIRIITNGTLLNRMSDSFWESCRANSIGFDLTVYPLYPSMDERVKFLFELMRTKGIKRVALKRATSFYVFYNAKGNSDPKLSYRKCKPGLNGTPNLRHGRIYSCPIPTYINIFNKRFGTQIPSDGYIRIYDRGLSGWDVKKALEEGPSACRYCTFGWDTVPKIPWAHSNRIIKDWEPTDIPTQKS
jgi:hypothetical protein